MTSRFAEKVALVTGAGSGMGRAITIRLAGEGATVFAVDINAGRLEETKKLSEGTVVLHHADLAEPATCATAVRACVDGFGRLDVLGNVAGIYLAGHATDMSLDEYRRLARASKRHRRDGSCMRVPGRAALTTETLLDGLGFPEVPRWHEGRLWFSDFHQRLVRSVGTDGDVRVELDPGDVPAGLGWDPQGRLLVVSMIEKRLLRCVDGSTEVVADLGPWTVMGANDMAVDSRGRAYIGNFGYDFTAGEDPRPTSLVLVDVDGRAGPVTPAELVCPNGIIVDEGRRRLIVAETFAHRVTVYDLAGDGSLSGGRPFARFDQGIDPDGICLDPEGEVWLATAGTPEVLRVKEGGEVTARVELSSGLSSYAVALGDADGRTLFVCSAPGIQPVDPGGGRIEYARLT